MCQQHEHFCVNNRMTRFLCSAQWPCSMLFFSLLSLHLTMKMNREKKQSWNCSRENKKRLRRTVERLHHHLDHPFGWVVGGVQSEKPKNTTNQRRREAAAHRLKRSVNFLNFRSILVCSLRLVGIQNSCFFRLNFYHDPAKSSE